MKPSRALLAATALSQVLAAAHAAEFTHGPLLGLPTSNSIKIWARTSAPTSFHVRYGTSAKALDSVSQPATTSLGHDNTATATLTGLQPGIFTQSVSDCAKSAQLWTFATKLNNWRP